MPIDILIVEDSRLQAELLRGRLESAGYQTRVAHDGHQALELIRQSKPDLVVTDVAMPVMDGYDLCRAIKRSDQLRNIPVVLLSGLEDPEDIIRGLDARADNYITKSCTAEYLLGRIESLLHTSVAAEEPDEPLEVTLGGKTYTVDAGRRQVLNLLVSTFANAVEKNRELVRVNSQLQAVQQDLERRSLELQQLNFQLHATNERMTRDLAAGAALQRLLLPGEVPRNGTFDFSWSFHPSAELAGDLLNIFPLDDHRLAVYLVDVSGHGVAAALLSVSISRMLSPDLQPCSLLIGRDSDSGETLVVPPAQVLSELNRLFPMEGSGGFYFAVLYGVLDCRRREFCYASAGQPPVLRLMPDGGSEYLSADGFPIGWFEDAEYDQALVSLEPGERLFLYSDGFPEAFSRDGQPFGKAGLLRSLQASRGRPLQDSLDGLIRDVQGWCGGGGPDDDLSIVAVEVTA